MIVEFEQEYLSELYKTGQCKSKKYRGCAVLCPDKDLIFQ